MKLPNNVSLCFDEINAVWFLAYEFLSRDEKQDRKKYESICEDISKDSNCQKLKICGESDGRNKAILLRIPSGISPDKIVQAFEKEEYEIRGAPLKEWQLYQETNAEPGVFYLRVGEYEDGKELRKKVANSIARKDLEYSIEFDKDNSIVTIKIKTLEKIELFKEYYSKEVVFRDIEGKVEKGNSIIKSQFYYDKNENVFFIIAKDKESYDALASDSAAYMRRNIYDFTKLFSRKKLNAVAKTILFYPLPEKTPEEIKKNLHQHLHKKILPGELMPDQRPMPKQSILSRAWFYDPKTQARFTFLLPSEDKNAVYQQLADKFFSLNINCTISVNSQYGENAIAIIKDVDLQDLPQLDQALKNPTSQSMPEIQKPLQQWAGHVYYDEKQEILYQVVDNKNLTLKRIKDHAQQQPFSRLVESKVEEMPNPNNDRYRIYQYKIKSGIKIDSEANWQILQNCFQDVGKIPLEDFKTNKRKIELPTQKKPPKKAKNQIELTKIFYDAKAQVYFIECPPGVTIGAFENAIKADENITAHFADKVFPPTRRICYMLPNPVVTEQVIATKFTVEPKEVPEDYHVLYKVPDKQIWFFIVENNKDLKNIRQRSKGKIQDNNVVIYGDSTTYDQTVVIIDGNAKKPPLTSKAIKETLSVLRCEERDLPLKKLQAYAPLHQRYFYEKSKEGLELYLPILPGESFDQVSNLLKILNNAYNPKLFSYANEKDMDLGNSIKITFEDEDKKETFIEWLDHGILPIQSQFEPNDSKMEINDKEERCLQETIIIPYGSYFKNKTLLPSPPKKAEASDEESSDSSYTAS